MAPITAIFAASVGLAVMLDVLAPAYSLGRVAGTCVLFFLQLLAYEFYAIILEPQYVNPLRHLPTAPGSHFIFGHIKRILQDTSGYPMREWIETVPNNGMIRYYMWFNHRVLITQPNLLSEILVTKNYDFIKPAHVRTALARILGVGILLAEGEDHKVQRKTLMPAFAFRHVKNLYPVFWRKARELVECAAEAADPEKSSQRINEDTENSHQPGAIDVSKWASRATLDIIGVSGMGQDFNSLKDPNSKLYQTYQTIFNPPTTVDIAIHFLRLLLPGWLIDRIPVSRNVVLDNAVGYIRKVCQDLISQKRQSLEKKERSDVDILSVALESGGFTDSQLIDQMMTFLAAGHETTATAMAAAAVLMCRNPDVQTRLREEIRAHIPPLSSEITHSDIDDCHYLQAFCSEVLRIWSPVSLTFRIADRDTTVGGEFIPKGTTMVLVPWAVNVSKKLWGDDAHEFKPERWLDADGKANHQGSASSNYSFLTFLHGPRSCIGQRFAQAEFACLIAAWVGTFETKFEEGSKLYEDNGEMAGEITNKPKDGVWCTVRKVPGWE